VEIEPHQKGCAGLNKLHIHTATSDDVPCILQFIRDLARYEKAEHEVLATEEMLHDSLFGETRCADALIASYEQRPAGFALYFFSYSTWLGKPGLYLEDLYVDPAYRNHGIGKEMLKRLARIAIQRGCGRFEWSVLDWNEPSIKFYEGLGATAQNEWIKYRLAGDELADLAGNE